MFETNLLSYNEPSLIKLKAVDSFSISDHTYSATLIPKFSSQEPLVYKVTWREVHGPAFLFKHYNYDDYDVEMWLLVSFQCLILAFSSF